MLKLSQIWPVGSLWGWLLSPFNASLLFFKHIFLLWHKMLSTHLSFWLSLAICHYCRRALVRYSGKWYFIIQDLGASCAHGWRNALAVLMVTSRLSAGQALWSYVCMCVYTKTLHHCMWLVITILDSATLESNDLLHVTYMLVTEATQDLLIVHTRLSWLDQPYHIPSIIIVIFDDFVYFWLFGSVLLLGLLSSCGNWGLLPSCGVLASHWGTWAPRMWAS